MRNWALVIVLSGLSMLGAFSIDAYLPSFHAIAEDLKITRVAVQQTLTVYLATYAFMTLFYGTLSDTFGRKPVILISVVGYTVGSLCATVAPNLELLLVSRAIQGLSAGAGAVVGVAVVRDLYPGAEGQKMMSYVKMVFSLAPAVAPVLGGWLEVWFGWRSIFGTLTLAGIVTWIATYRVLPESLPVEQRHPLHLRPILRRYWKVSSNRAFMLQALGIGMSFAGFSVYVSTAPDFVMKVLHLPETAFGWLFIPIITGMMAGSWCSAKLAGRMEPLKVVWLAYTVIGVTVLTNLAYTHWFTPAIPWAVIPPMVYMFGFALSSPTMTLRLMDLFPEMRGLAASLQGFVQMVIFACVTGMVAPLVMGDAVKLSMWVVCGWLCSLVLWWLGMRFHPAEKAALESKGPE